MNRVILVGGTLLAMFSLLNGIGAIATHEWLAFVEAVGLFLLAVFVIVRARQRMS